jgi:putative tricarboxylic transport membrane protein
MRINDALLGGALWVLALVMLWQTRGFPAMPGQTYGPALVPILLAAGFLLCGLLLARSGLATWRDGPALALGSWARRGGRLADVALLLGGLVLLMALWDRLGFLLGGTLYTALLIHRFRGGRPLRAILVALAACLAVDWAFRRLLLVPLPMGPLTGLIW